MEFKAVLVQPGDWQTESKWVIIISNNGHTETFDYTMGCGHRRFVKRFLGAGFLGRPPQGFIPGQKVPMKFGSWTSLEARWLKDFTEPTEPEKDDVMHCLVTDAVCGDQCFEDFCSEFGYDDDSRTAYQTWEACQKTRYKLRKLELDIVDLAEKYQDY